MTKTKKSLNPILSLPHEAMVSCKICGNVLLPEEKNPPFTCVTCMDSINFYASMDKAGSINVVILGVKPSADRKFAEGSLI